MHSIEKNNPAESFSIKMSSEDIDHLSSFFDLLARFDFEDNQKEKLGVNSDILVSAPKISELDSNFLK